MQLLEHGVHEANCTTVSNSIFAAHFPRPQRGVTPLAAAAARGHLGVVEALLEAGANTESRDKVRLLRRRGPSWALSPLRLVQPMLPHAAAYGTADALRNSASLTHGRLALAGLQDENTPLLSAARWGHSECLRALIKGGADMSAKNKVRPGPSALFLTPLSAAAASHMFLRRCTGREPPTARQGKGSP